MALAINLAYLNLPIFRYRHQIKLDAEARLSQLRNDNAVDTGSVGHLDQLNDIMFLAEEPGSIRPVGSTFWWYSITLGRRVDIYASIAFSLYAGLLVFAGAAHNLGLWDSLPRTLGPWPSSIVFYLLIVAVVLPPIFVVLGRRAMWWAWARTKHCSEQIAAIFAAKAKAAEAPDLSEMRRRVAAVADEIYGKDRKA